MEQQLGAACNLRRGCVAQTWRENRKAPHIGGAYGSRYRSAVGSNVATVWLTVQVSRASACRTLTDGAEFATSQAFANWDTRPGVMASR